jgi:hypothetical protein
MGIDLTEKWDLNYENEALKPTIFIWGWNGGHPPVHPGFGVEPLGNS